MTTTAILCIARNELPFTEEWLEYHFALGIDRVYYVSTDVDSARVEAFFEGSRFRSRVELLHFDSFEPGWQMGCYNAHLPLIAEDWVLVIDLDEFLYLNTFSSIGGYLETISADVGQVQFPWLLSMSHAYHHERALDVVDQAEKYVSDHVKSMVRRRVSDGLGIHNHSVRGLKSRLSSGVEAPNEPRHAFLLDDVGYFDRNPFILHLCSRGHLEVLIRIVDQRFFNAKCGQSERESLARYLLGRADWANLPNRYLLMKFYASLPAANVRCSFPALDSTTDVDELEQIFLANMGGFVDLRHTELRDVEEEFERRHRLVEKLASQDLGALPDLNDYLGCSTQLEYVSRLRRSLVNASTV